MAKLKSFVRLDFMTVKPYFTLKTMLIYAVMAIFLTTFSKNISSGMGVGMMLGTLFVGYPFALGEKSNMDVLYATLSVNRKTVVLCRYLFALLLNVCMVIFSVALGMAGMLVANAFGREIAADGTLMATIALSALFILIQSIQLPLYFKLGYSKAKFLSIVPFAAIMAGYIFILSLQKVSNILPESLTRLFDSWLTIPLFVGILLLIVCISYRLSIMFYNKREF